MCASTIYLPLCNTCAYHHINIYTKITERGRNDDRPAVGPANPSEAELFNEITKNQTSGNLQEGLILDLIQMNPDARWESNNPEVYTMTISDLPMGTKYEHLYAHYINCHPDFLPDKSYVLVKAGRAYLGFSSEDGYRAGIAFPCKYGQVCHPSYIYAPNYKSKVWLPASYNPLADQSVFHRLVYAVLEPKDLDYQRVARAFELAPKVHINMYIKTSLTAPQLQITISSCNINTLKSCVTVYLENEMDWKLAMNHPHVLVPTSYDGLKPSSVLRLLVSLSVTNNPEWTRLWVARLPFLVDIERVRNGLRDRIGVLPEVVSLYYDPESHRPKNFGFILTKNEEIVTRLLNATMEQRRYTVQGRDRTIIIARAVSKKNKHGNAWGAPDNQHGGWD